MAAEIKSGPKQGNVRKPDLFSKLEGFNDDVNMAVFIPREDGVITVSDDKYVKDFAVPEVSDSINIVPKFDAYFFSIHCACFYA